jgi:hypothetical protein
MEKVTRKPRVVMGVRVQEPAREQIDTLAEIVGCTRSEMARRCMTAGLPVVAEAIDKGQPAEYKD